MAWGALAELFPGFGGSGRWLPLLEAHARIIERARGRVRVSAVEGEDVVRRQYAESLETMRVAVESGGTPERLVDVGSGGGFPGMVAACVLPETRVTLVEPLKKRAALLAEVAAELGMRNVEVVAQRAEEAARGPLRASADTVTARAVAELRVLVEYTAPFAKEGGLVVLPKGSGVDQELTRAEHAFGELGCEVALVERMREEVGVHGRVVVLRRLGALAERYPRRVGIPAKRPL